MWHCPAHRSWCSELKPSTATPTTWITTANMCEAFSTREKNWKNIPNENLTLFRVQSLLKLNVLSLFSGRFFFICCALCTASPPSVTNWRWVMLSALKSAGQRGVCQIPSLTWWDSHAWAGNQSQRRGGKEVLNKTSEGSQTNWSGWNERGLGMFCEDQRSSNKPPSASYFLTIFENSNNFYCSASLCRDSIWSADGIGCLIAKLSNCIQDF